MDALKLQPLNRELYKNDKYLKMGLGIFLGVSLFLDWPFAVLALLLYASFPIVAETFTVVKEEKKNTKVSVEQFSGVAFGLDETERKISLPIEILNHAFIIGMTRFGKTRLAYALICSLIQQYKPEELLIAFSDAKAVSFNVFSESKHLFAPIAKSEEATGNLIELLLEEMYRRQNLFGQFTDRICTNVDEYYALTGEKLPRIVVFFDEVADSVEQGSQAEKNLTSLAKMGLGSGIHLVLITQRPTKEGITHEVTSQAITILSTFMKNATEYGSVAKIPKSVYSKMVEKLKDGGTGKGLFMMFNPDLVPYFVDINEDYEGWGFVQGLYVDNAVVEGIAQNDIGLNPNLPALESSIPAWAGGEEEKLDAIEALEIKLGAVTVEDMVKQFGIGKRTAKEWLQRYENN